MDQRTGLEKALWARIGPPLYYCADCLRGVRVHHVPGAEPLVKRPCGPECGAGIVAPRRAICVGKGGASMPTKVKTAALQLAAGLTGRCV